ncbi:MAG TPA: DUF1570 domain-containing protein [Candidatus Limnocylindrales bacterium]|nr:DUF1570 domain-containing protein [Candidatus Limnocylindrales bacterium]
MLLLVTSVPAFPAGKDAWIEVRSPNFTVISNAGEKEARKIADQFEQFREMFHSSFKAMRVDLGKPLIIFAARDENALKQLLPSYWEAKGRVHPGGIYAQGEDRHFVALRTDIVGENPYEVVYHEYTHAILNLNFRNLPLWLSEGLAEFYGNSTIYKNFVSVGRISRGRLRVLQEGRLIPIETLLQADLHSPYYNEEDRASLFYAESWAIVHYLLTDPEASKRQLLVNFLKAWDASGNQLEAAAKAFGDLKQFSEAMEAYSHQQLFYTGRVNTTLHGDAKSYSSRELPPAELAADRAIFYVHTHRPVEARISAEQAIKADPDLPLAHEALGLLAYSEGKYGAAERTFSRAIELHSTSYFPYYFSAQARLRHNRPSEDDTPEIAEMLEKAIAMNPQFAPAYAALARVYSLRKETQKKALVAGRKAVELEPGNLSNAINFGYVLLTAEMISDAKAFAARIVDAAKTPEEKAEAEQLRKEVENQESYEKAVAEAAERAKRAQAEELALKTAEGANPTAPGEEPAIAGGEASKRHAGQTEYASEGNIFSAECNPDSRGIVILRVGKSTLRFYYAKLSDLYIVSTAKADSGEAPPCKAWIGRRARLYFYQSKDKPFMGELDTIQFF